MPSNKTTAVRGQKTSYLLWGKGGGGWELGGRGVHTRSFTVNPCKWPSNFVADCRIIPHSKTHSA